MEIKEYLVAKRDYFDSQLNKFLPCPNSYPPVLRQAMEYSLFAGGKRLRPILTLAAAEVCGGTSEQALSAAAAVEMVHTYSLIHDDLPAMDDDDLRRGKPTCHIAFGEAIAILAGDALLTHAFSVLAQSANSGRGLALVAELAAAAGPAGMVAGQVLDIAGSGMQDFSQVTRIHRCKTGAMIRAAVRMGAIVAGAGAKIIAALTEYAESLGLAFQIIDDILDVTATSQQLGKNPGSDEKKGKQTFVTVYGLEEARKMASAETARAVHALHALGGDYSLLQDLAEYVGQRKN